MKSSRFHRRAGWFLIGLSLLLHLLTVFAFARQPDRLAAFTVVPIWLWGGCGLFLSVSAFWFLRAPLSLVLTGVWALTILLGADEARVIAHVATPAPHPARPAPPKDDHYSASSPSTADTSATPAAATPHPISAAGTPMSFCSRKSYPIRSATSPISSTKAAATTGSTPATASPPAGTSNAR